MRWNPRKTSIRGSLAVMLLFSYAMAAANALPDRAEAQSDEHRAGQNLLSIHFTGEGELAINRQPMDIDDFLEALRRAALKQPRPNVKLLIAPEAQWGRIFQITEQLHYEGFGRLDLGVKPGEAVRTGSLHLRMTRNGGLYAGNRQIKLSDALAKLEKGAGDAVVHLQIDERADWQTLREILQTIAEADVNRLSFRGRQIELTDAGPLPSVQPNDQPTSTSEPQPLRSELLAVIEGVRAMRSELMVLRNNAWAETKKVENPAAVLTDAEQTYRKQADAATDGAEPDELYSILRACEQDMITVYREMLAGWIIARREIPYEEAYELTETPRPVRLDELAAEDASAAGRRDRAREQLRAIVANCRRLLQFARQRVAATASGNGASLDLDSDDVAASGYRGPELLPDEIDFTHQRSTSPLRPVTARRLSSDLYGDAEWICVDTWYIIGPFAGDRRRTELGTRFGPESHVRLTDRYAGKNGTTLTWDYRNVGQPSPTSPTGSTSAFWKVEPEHVERYAIYYAFTEIYSEQEQDLWIAPAVDDYGKLWVNDELLWMSPRDRKPYNATENIQRVSLRKGHNKVLMRVENAGGTMGFSLLIRSPRADDRE